MSEQFDALLTAYAEAVRSAALYADQDDAKTAAMWATVAEDHRRKIVAAYAELEAQRDELRAEYRRLWNAGIDHANSGGTVEAGKPEMTYAALFRTLMQSRFWNESIVANAAPGAQ